MKYGPCEWCLIGPVCSMLCDDKFKDLIKEASKEKDKRNQDVTLGDFLNYLDKKERMKIRKIEVVDEPV